LRTLMYLALRPDTLCTIEEVASAYRISVNHLTKVVHQAAQAGEVHTVRGQHGGLRLARAAAAINIGAVLRRTEPDLHIAPCFAGGAGCCIAPACVLQHALGDALAAFLAVMDRMSLADLVRPKRSLSELLRLDTAVQGRSHAPVRPEYASGDCT